MEKQKQGEGVKKREDGENMKGNKKWEILKPEDIGREYDRN